MHIGWLTATYTCTCLFIQCECGVPSPRPDQVPVVFTVYVVIGPQGGTSLSSVALLQLHYTDRRTQQFHMLINVVIVGVASPS